MTAESLRQKLMDELSSYDVNMPEYYEFRQKIIHTLIDILCEQRQALEYYKQFAQLPPEIQLKERIGGGRAAITLAAGDERLKAMGVL